MAGPTRQTNKSDPNKPYSGFLAKGGKRFNAILTIKSKEELQKDADAKAALDESKSNNASAVAKPSPKNVLEAAEQLRTEKQNPFGWTLINTGEKGLKAIMGEDGMPYGQQIFE
jgi:hypothetical protein